MDPRRIGGVVGNLTLPQEPEYATVARVRNLRERLEQEKAQHGFRLAQINEALALLERNPDIERLMDLL